MYLRRKCYSSLYDYDYNDYLYEKTFSDAYDYYYDYYTQKIFANLSDIRENKAEAAESFVKGIEKGLASLQEALKTARGKKKIEIERQIKEGKESLRVGKMQAGKARSLSNSTNELAEQMARGREEAAAKRAREEEERSIADALERERRAKIHAERVANRDFVDPTTRSMDQRRADFYAKQKGKITALNDVIAQQNNRLDRYADYVNGLRGARDEMEAGYKKQIEDLTSHFNDRIAGLSASREGVLHDMERQGNRAFELGVQQAHVIRGQKKTITELTAKNDAEIAARKKAEEDAAKYKGELEKGLFGWARKNKKLAGLAAAGSGLGLLGAGAGINHAISSRNHR